MTMIKDAIIYRPYLTVGYGIHSAQIAFRHWSHASERILHNKPVGIYYLPAFFQAAFTKDEWPRTACHRLRPGPPAIFSRIPSLCLLEYRGR